MSVSNTPPALPGELYPVLKTMDDLLGATVTTVTGQGNSITALNATVTGQGNSITALAATVTTQGDTVTGQGNSITVLNNKPYVAAFLTSYSIGTSKAFSSPHIRGFTDSGTSLTCTVTGKYRVTLTAATDTNQVAGGYFWLLVNGVRQQYPAITYCLYNSSTSDFLVQLTANDVLTFEISGTTMWNSGSSIKTTHFTLECLN
jgi:hypothetical protein